jgi:hypothetical protein
MIKQAAVGLDSRSEANLYMENDMLPLITAPMYTVVDESNYQTFLGNKINVCLPRGVKGNKNCFHSYSIDEFRKLYSLNNSKDINLPYKVCLDTANGAMPYLHKTIEETKRVYGDKLIIMAGNVSSLEAFKKLATTGVDYIRVGVGGSEVCGTSVNTGVGQEDLESLIKFCGMHKYNHQGAKADFACKNTAKVKIVADGITGFQKQLQARIPIECMDNGYAAINRLLYAGADLVMIGNLFNKALESAGEKKIFYNLRGVPEEYNLDDFSPKTLGCNDVESLLLRGFNIKAKYSGMSTKESQSKYKKGKLRHSEGRAKYNKVMWTLKEWLNGSENKPDELPGFINCLQSAMSYTGSKTLKDFKCVNY